VDEDVARWISFASLITKDPCVDRIYGPLNEKAR
jgi:hypothetical protein